MTRPRPRAGWDKTVVLYFDIDGNDEAMVDAADNLYAVLSVDRAATRAVLALLEGFRQAGNVECVKDRAARAVWLFATVPTDLQAVVYPAIAGLFDEHLKYVEPLEGYNERTTALAAQEGPSEP